MDEDQHLLRSVAMQNAHSILLARQQYEDALLQAKCDLEAKTEQLAKSLATIRATLESTTDGILAVDNAFRITAFNRRFLEMTGLSEEHITSGDHSNVDALVSVRLIDPAAYLRRLEEIYASSMPESYDLLEFADGRVVERFSRIQYVHGDSNGRVWSYRDITARRQAELGLQEEKRVLALLNEAGAKLASSLDVEAVLQAVTDAATAIIGARFGAFFYNAIDEEGEVFVLYTLSGASRDAFDKFGYPRATALFGPTFNGAPAIRSDDVLVDPRYGKSAPHHGMPPGHLAVRSYLAVPVISRSTEVLGGLFFGHPEVGMFTERSERLVISIASQAAVAIDNARLYAAAQRAAVEREQLLESERAARTAAERMSSMKDEFLATLSHELRTPLGAILGWAQILRRGAKNEQDLYKGLETIERNARGQAQLIEDLLDMSRITSGKLRIDVQPVDAATVVQAAIESVRPLAAAKNLGLDVAIDHQAGQVPADPGRLQQIIWNLLSNAIKFTPPEGTVQVRLTRLVGQVEITVSDNGAGIAPEFLPLVFDRFRQADGSTTRSYGGLGLGLSIVKSLTELHGGSVAAASHGHGKGASFTVVLPALGPCDRHEPQGGSRELPKGHSFDLMDLSGLKVLVVDDEPDARAVLARQLEDCAATVITAASAEQALEVLRVAVLRGERLDVLVSDIGMPEVDGYEFLRRVRALPPEHGGRIPAIALTAFARSQDRTRALRAGYLAHVAKPVEPSELVATVASVAGRTGLQGG
jgi:PAS domain S-box-containing protein